MMKIEVCFAFLVTLTCVSCGVVNPVSSCGGKGTPVQLRIERCSGAPPCTVEPNIDTMVEEDFIPAESSKLAKVRVLANLPSMGKPITIFDVEIGALTAGKIHTAASVMRISQALSKKSVTGVLEVYDVASGRIEICLKAPINIA